MLLYVEVHNKTLSLIAELNGSTPTVEEGTVNYFVFNTDRDGVNEVITEEEFEKLVNDAEEATIVPIVLLG